MQCNSREMSTGPDVYLALDFYMHIDTHRKTTKK